MAPFTLKQQSFFDNFRHEFVLYVYIYTYRLEMLAIAEILNIKIKINAIECSWYRSYNILNIL